MKSVAVLFLIGYSCSLLGQLQVHSHNDYAQEKPLYGALEAYAQSIEIDVILKDTVLYVAHEVQSIAPNKTLNTLYLDPLIQLISENDPRIENLQLLIDVKTEAYASLNAIIKALTPLERLSYPAVEDGLRFVISGNRPAPADYRNYPSHILFDCQEIDQTPESSWSKIAMISKSFRRFSNWDGSSDLANEENERIKAFIKKAKTFKKPVRLWAVPDSPKAWQWSRAVGLDYINTDQPKEVRAFFEN